MKITKSKFYTSLFAIVIIMQLYIPSFKINIIFQILALGIYLILEKKLIIRKSFFKFIIPLFLLLAIGFTGVIIHKYNLVDIIKDVFHFVKPITGLLIGYFLCSKINNLKLFVKTIVLLGFGSAIIHFFIIIFFSGISSITSIREYSRDNYLEVFSVFFLIFYEKFQNEYLFRIKRNHKIILFTLLTSCVLYFSRTMFVVSIVILLTILGYTKITTKALKLIGILVISVIVLYTYLYSVKIDRAGQGLESFLYKVKIAPEEIFKTKIDIENHKNLWDHWRGYEASRAYQLMIDNPSSFVFGTGFGSLVNLKFEAPLTGEEEKGMKYISQLHNGFAYILYKTGIIGLIIYLNFLFTLYKVIYYNEKFTGVFTSSIGLLFFFTTLTITGIYNSKDVIIFILGALLFFKEKN